MGLSEQQVVKLSTGPPLAMAFNARTQFWEFLHSWGGNWMWEMIERVEGTPSDISWIVEGLQNGSLLWVCGSQMVHTAERRLKIYAE